MVPGTVKPHRAALAFLVPLALLALVLGIRTAWRERTRPGRELSALLRARSAAQELADGPLPALDALADRAHEDLLPADAVSLPGLQDFAILSLDRKERAVVWHHAGPPSKELVAISSALRGEETVGNLAALGLRDPPPAFARVWSHGVEDGVARVTLVLGRRRGLRVIVVLCEARAPVG